MSEAVLVLASASPRRAELLREAGIAFEVDAADVDETLRPNEPPADYVRRLAEAKASLLPAITGEGRVEVPRRRFGPR